MGLTNYIPKPIKRKIKSSSFLYKLYQRRQNLVKLPYAMNIEITTKCNLKCWMCARPRMKNLKVGDMDFGLFKRIVDDMAKLVYEKTSFTLVGLGEPLMYDKLFDAIEYVKTKCPKASIHINTNATLLDLEKSEILCKLLRGGDRLLFSLNAGNRSTYKWMMGADKFDLVVSNIKNFLAIRKKIGKGPSVVIQIIETKKTEPEIEGFKNFWQPLIDSNDNIYIRQLINWGGKIDTKDVLVKVKGKRYPCLSLWIAVVVDLEGNVYPCCEALSTRENSDLLLGNIQEKSLTEIYSESKIREIRKKHLNNKWNDIAECSNCDSWSFYPNIWFKVGSKWR